LPTTDPPADPGLSPDDDSDLLPGLRSNDSKSWTGLINRYQNRLYTVCLRMVHDRDLAADLTQDAFVKVIQGFASYDGRSKLSTWMIRVTMNVCLSKLRSEKLRRHASLDRPSTSDPDGGPWSDSFSDVTELSPVASVEANDDRERVLRALASLEPDQRAVLILSDCRGQSYEDIASTLSVAVGTVKSRLFRARAALRDAVERLSNASEVSRKPRSA